MDGDVRAQLRAPVLRRRAADRAGARRAGGRCAQGPGRDAGTEGARRRPLPRDHLRIDGRHRGAIGAGGLPADRPRLADPARGDPRGHAAPGRRGGCRRVEGHRADDPPPDRLRDRARVGGRRGQGEERARHRIHDRGHRRRGMARGRSAPRLATGVPRPRHRGLAMGRYRTSDDRLPPGEYEPIAEPHWEVRPPRPRRSATRPWPARGCGASRPTPSTASTSRAIPGTTQPLDPGAAHLVQVPAAADQRDDAQVRLHPARRPGHQGEVRRDRGDPRGGGGVAAAGRPRLRRGPHGHRRARPVLRLSPLSLPRLPGARARAHGRGLHPAHRLHALPGLRMAGGGAALPRRLHRNRRGQGLGLLRAARRSIPPAAGPPARTSTRCGSSPCSSTTGTTRRRTSAWCACPRRRTARNGPCPQPFAFLQDLGSTFGPNKVKLESWSTRPRLERRRHLRGGHEGHAVRGSDLRNRA